MTRLFATLLWLASLCLPATAEPVRVFAAASLRGALTQIAQDFTASGGAPVTLSFAGSGTLARQIAAGAPADAVVLAHPDWAAWLQAREFLLPGAIASVAGGALVLIGPATAAPLPAPDAQQLLEALRGGRLAIGQRNAVPAGRYTREWLGHIGAWDALQSHLAETDNVRSALALVAQGAAPLGVVYASDAAAEPRVRVLYRVPANAHTPIRYPAAALTRAGCDFTEYLTSPQAVAVFTEHGFGPVAQ